MIFLCFYYKYINCIFFSLPPPLLPFRYWTVERPRTGQTNNYQAVKRSCRERGVLFEDSSFPPNNRSLTQHKKLPFQPIIWARPHVSLLISVFVRYFNYFCRMSSTIFKIMQRFFTCSLILLNCKFNYIL